MSKARQKSLATLRRSGWQFWKYINFKEAFTTRAIKHVRYRKLAKTTPRHQRLKANERAPNTRANQFEDYKISKFRPITTFPNSTCSQSDWMGKLKLTGIWNGNELQSRWRRGHWYRILRAVLTCRHIAPLFNNYLVRNCNVIKHRQIVGWTVW